MNNKATKKVIKYILPDFLSFERNKALIDIYEKYKFIPRDNTEIYSFYGTFPNTIWNGGSIMFSDIYYTREEMKRVRDYYNKKGIVLTFTFTNSLITEEHLNDEYCNLILKVFHNGMNEVLVVSSVLEKYIRENYPKYKINRSIINTKKVPFLLGNYHLSVISKFKNKDFEFLNSLNEEEKSKTEILCNEFCVNDCPYAYKHYEEYAYIQLYNKYPENCDKKYAECRYPDNKYCFLKNRFSNSKYMISPDEISEKYTSIGFQYFKLSGRGEYNSSALQILIEYLIKPKYQNDVRTYIIERMLMSYSIDKREMLKFTKL